MLYHLLYYFHHEITPLNVVRYITFRTAVASLTALFLVLALGPWTIERLRALQIGQYIREEGPQGHKAKAGTPTMGGVLILAGILIPTLLWGDLANRNVWILMLSTLAFGVIGFADDYLKVVKKRSLGLSARRKLWGQILVGLVLGSALYVLSLTEPTLYSTRVLFSFGLLHPLRRRRGGGLEQLREPDRRPRRPGHRLDAHRRGRLHRPRLRHRPSRLLGIPGRALPAGGRRGHGLLWGHGRSLDGLPLVELLSGPGVHGRRREPVAGRGSR